MRTPFALITYLVIVAFHLQFAQSFTDQKLDEFVYRLETSKGQNKLMAYRDYLEYLLKKKPLKAIEVAKDGIDYASKIDDLAFNAEMLLFSGIAHSKLSQPLEALKYYTESYELALKCKDSLLISRVLIKIGAAKITTGDINQSIQNFIEAENIAKRLNDYKTIIDATNYLGISYYILDNLQEAINFSEKALKLCSQVDYEEGKADAYEHYAIVYIKQGNYNLALEFNDKAFKIRKDFGDLPGIAAIYYNYSVIYNRLNNFEKAIEYTKNSIETRKIIGNINGVGSNYLTLGNIFLRTEQPDSALFYLKRAYDIKIGTGDNRAITSIVKSLSDVYEKKKDFLNAHKYLRTYKSYSDSLYNEDTRRISAKILAQQELVRKESEIQHLKDVNDYQKQQQKFLIIIIILSILLTAAFVVLYFNNIKANKKLSLTNNELITLNSDREKFFRIITHDLRSPFHPIIAYSDLILNNFETLKHDELKEFLLSINISTKKIYDLLDNLLQWLSMNTGKMEFSPNVINLKNELENTLKLFESNIKNKSLTIFDQTDKNVNVFADAKMLGIILRNIISNAIKFSKQNGIVSISTIITGGFIEVVISDNGVGILPEEMSFLFTDLRKTSKGTDNESGTGLGLMLCKEMTERNGGKLRIESEVNVGTTLRFTLPSTKE